MLKERLKELRYRHNLSQRDLASILKLSPSTIAMYETDQREPDFDTLKRLAVFFDVTTDYLLGRTDTPALTDRAEPTLDDEIHQIIKDLGPDVTLQFHDLKGMDDEEKENLIIFLQGLKARRNLKQ